MYDAGVGAAGGCTVIDVSRDGANLGEWVGISGTLTNCAGGPTPWGTWMTCEETENKANGTTRLKDHGYVFEVWGDGKTAHPVPLKALGRYAHEALAIDEDRTHVYLSEDASGPNGTFYRWSAPRGYKLGPSSWQDLQNKDFGTLEALAILGDDGKPIPDVAYLTSAQLLRPFRVAWVPVPDRDAATKSVRNQFTDGQITRGKKFEGVYGTKRGRVRRELVRRVRHRRPAGRRGPARRHGLVLQLRRQDHPAGHLLPGERRRGLAPRRSTRTSTSTARTTSPSRRGAR